MTSSPVHYAVLRHLCDWEETATWSGLEPEPDGVLALARLPDPIDGETIREPVPDDASLSGLIVGPDGDVYLADAVGHSLVRVMGGCGENRFVLAHGRGHAPGRFDRPRGMVIGPNGLYVADSGNARVQVFRLPTLELRDVWEGSLREPVALTVDSHNRIYVLDRGLERVLRFAPAGVPDESYNLAISRSALQSPAAIALDAAGHLYVSDDHLDLILRFDVDGQPLPSLAPAGGPAQPRALAVHGNRLYIADAEGGGIWVHHESHGWLGTLPGYRGPVSALAFDATGRLYLKPGLDDRYHVLEPNRACVSSGTLTAGPFDAGEESQWERVQVQLESPAGSSAELRLFTADSPVPAPTESDWASPATLAPALDTLVPPPRLGETPSGGQRYLWLRVQLRSEDAHASPRLFQVQAATTGESYLDHLPAVYARDDAPAQFLARWLALFRAEFGDWEEALDEMPRRFDPDTTEESALKPLSAWLAFELPRRAEPDAWRRLIPEIHRLHERRGTVFGVRELCELYTGARPHLFEAFSERHVWQLGQTSRLGFDTALAAAAPAGMVVPGFVRSDPAYAGLLGDYYAGINFDQLKHTRINATVSFAWGSKSPLPDVPADGFSVRWTGQIRPRHSEVYTFITTSDDGVRLWIDGRLIIDEWNDHPPTEHSGRITLQAERWYAITLEYYEKAGSATIALAWSSRSQRREIIPQDRMYALIDEGAQAGGGASQTSDETLLVGQTVVGASGPLASSDYGAPLFQDEAHLFTVLLPAAKLRKLPARELLGRVVEAEKPAHTDFHLCFVEARMRVGFQARVGIDSIVAGPPAPMAMTGTVLGQDSYLGEGGERTSRVGKRARVGRETIVG
jgi:phage tail-like protein